MAVTRKQKSISERRKKNLKFKANKARQKETYKFTRRFYKFLREHSDHIFFKKLYGNVVGNYEPDTKDVIVDHRRDFLSTLIHEFTHHTHPEWSETRVLNYERRMINALTERQIRNILRALGESV